MAKIIQKEDISYITLYTISTIRKKLKRINFSIDEINVDDSGEYFYVYGTIQDKSIKICVEIIYMNNANLKNPQEFKMNLQERGYTTNDIQKSTLMQDFYIITFPVDVSYNLDTQQYHFYILTKNEMEDVLKKSIQDTMLEQFIVGTPSIIKDEIEIKNFISKNNHEKWDKILKI